jgi:hypothetical protein
MAGPVEQPGTVALLEDAAHLLRRAPFGAALLHWIGSAPFALALLVFWYDLTHPPVSDLVCAAESLALALLLIWMNCWRSAFADRLHRLLTGAPEGRWNARRVWRLASIHASLAGAKPVVLLFSLAAVFPFADAVAFYRNVAALAGREELTRAAVMAKARSLAHRDRFQCWLLQCVLLLLSLVAMVNVAATFILLPQLVRLFTGYESAFTRSGEGFVENRLFLLLVLAATWLIFDPFVQAVYCLRCFRAESVETGEDIRAGLRRIRSTIAGSGAVAAAVLALIAAPLLRADSVSPRELERAVRQTMQAPEYNWRVPPPPADASKTSWIIQATDHAIHAVQEAIRWAGGMIDRVLRWIFGGLGASQLPLGGRAPGAALHWSVWALIGLTGALICWVGWRAFRLRSRKPAVAARPPAGPVRLDDESLTADRLPEAGWLEMAERCLREGELRLALRAFFLANLAWLGRERFLLIDAGKTNHEFEIELRRRARQSPEARELFSTNVAAFERAWYGLHDVYAEDAREFRLRAEEIKTRLSAGASV